MAGLLTSKCHFLSIDESRQRGKSNWVAVDNLTHGPTEKEMYLSKNVRVQDGALILATVKEKHEDSSGKVHTYSLPLPLSRTLSHSLSPAKSTNMLYILMLRSRSWWQVYNFTSGWVESKHKQFQAYGRFEVRAKLPPAAVGVAGKWPVAWYVCVKMRGRQCVPAYGADMRSLHRPHRKASALVDARERNMLAHWW